MVELAEQPIPDVDVFCPRCGGEPQQTPDELRVQHRLSAMGYKHDDQTFTCSECEHDWTHGVPVGEYDLQDADDLRCHSCRHDPEVDETPWYFVHRVKLQRAPSAANRGQFTLHLKCPRCYLFASTTRETDRKGVALVGYPPITGEIKEDETPAYGWVPEVRLDGAE